ncbi:MAG: ABC transporter substrate-binding protein [Cytophagales bacterium]|nr:ABC transporter substrate-binding protein [Cytophagales bacterium]
MKRLIPFLIILIFSVDTYAQYKEKNYGNTPNEIVPYANFQNAYKKHFLEPWPFRGSGREKAEPAGLETVRIGLLAPLENSKDVPKGMQMKQGAMLALEQANAKGGYKGIPFELMPHNDVGLWGAAANEVVTMDDEGVWAILGSLNDIVTHVAIRVALKCEISVVNMADPDPTLTETNIPWVIRVISDDRQSSYALANRIYKVDNHQRVSLLRANNRYGRVGTGEFKDASRRMGHPVAVEVRFEDGHTDFTDQLNTIKKNNSDAVVLWGDAKEMGLIINQMREMGMNHPVYACDRAVTGEFLEVAGKNADGVTTTCQYNPKLPNPKYDQFVTKYKERFNTDPDVFAVHSYDAMNITIEAIRRAGLNRTKIRDLLTDMETFQNYKGASGEIVFDATWNDVGQIYMVDIKGNDFHYKPFEAEYQAYTGSVK